MTAFPRQKDSQKVQEERADSKIKCAEIFILGKTNDLMVYCSFCAKIYRSVKTFSKHLFESHSYSNIVQSYESDNFFENSIVFPKDSKKENVSEVIECNSIDPTLESSIGRDEKIQKEECKVVSESKIDDSLAGHSDRSDEQHVFKDDISHDSDSISNVVQNHVNNKSNTHFQENRKKKSNSKPFKKHQAEKKKSKEKKAIQGYFKCLICSKFIRKKEKQDHLKSHENVKRFMCETCGKGFNEHYQLALHIKNHTGERPFKCQFCSSTFKCKHTLRAHERSHLDYKPFKCSICGANFKSKHTVQQHELRHLAPTDLSFECDLCGKKFNTENKMNDHRGRHKFEGKPHQCPKCPKSFVSKYACTAHERLEHKGEFNYKCSFCDKVFIKIALKKAHETTHTRVGQPFPCDLCHKKYATREGLYKHKKRDHISNKPTPEIKCDKCNQIFVNQIIYIEHCRKHTLEENQFVCIECGANFSNEAKLNNHKKIIHDYKQIKSEFLDVKEF